MFQPGDHQYRLDQQRRNHLIQQSSRQQFVRQAIAKAPAPARAMGVWLLQLWNILFR